MPPLQAWKSCEFVQLWRIKQITEQNLQSLNCIFVAMEVINGTQWVWSSVTYYNYRSSCM